ncbi:hypothetical protein FAVG1_10694 [Fusarium avenaceum]|nr:hypothetical protein FAVG1_10694 [Fusarium avenaceum]
MDTFASVFAAFFLAIRVVSKITGPFSWGADDTLLALSSVLVVSLSISTLKMIHWGLGRNIWVLTEHQITTFFKFLVVNEFSYLLSLSLIKASILLFFLRIFQDTKFRKAAWWTLGYIAFSTALFTVLASITRVPFSLFWEGWKNKSTQGVVLDTNVLWMTHAVLNLLLDIWMLLLPATQTYRLGLVYKKKIGIIAMFSVGFFEHNSYPNSASLQYISGCH